MKIFYTNFVFDPSNPDNYGIIRTCSQAETSDYSDYTNLSKKEFKKVVNDAADKWNIKKFNKKETNLEFKYYKRIDSESIREIFVTGASHMNDNGGLDISSGNESDTQRTVRDPNLQGIYNQNGAFEQNNKNVDGTYNTASIVNQKTRYLSSITNGTGVQIYPADAKGNNAVAIDDTNQTSQQIGNLIDSVIK